MFLGTLGASLLGNMLKESQEQTMVLEIFNLKKEMELQEQIMNPN